MHAVGARLERKVRPVVQPKQRVVLVAEGPVARGRREHLVIRAVLDPQLDHVGSATERRPDYVVRDGLHDEVKARPAECLSRAQ